MKADYGTPEWRREHEQVNREQVAKLRKAAKADQQRHLTNKFGPKSDKPPKDKK
jgi:hypothetical protein